MTVRSVRQYPDAVLRKRARMVNAFDEGLQQLACDLLDTMYHHGGVGLAAPQLGISRCVLVARPDTDSDECLTLINPRILKTSHIRTTEREGCLSLAGVWCPVTRPISITWQAQNNEGDFIEGQADGWLARVLQHEMDHLNGKLISDHLSEKKKQQMRRRHR